MKHSKKKSAGVEERIAVLTNIRPSVEQEFQQTCNCFARNKVAKDDILDAMVAALTAFAKPPELRTLPVEPPQDACNLPMEMVYLPKTF